MPRRKPRLSWMYENAPKEDTLAVSLIDVDYSSDAPAKNVPTKEPPATEEEWLNDASAEEYPAHGYPIVEEAAGTLEKLDNQPGEVILTCTSYTTTL